MQTEIQRRRFLQMAAALGAGAALTTPSFESSLRMQLKLKTKRSKPPFRNFPS